MTDLDISDLAGDARLGATARNLPVLSAVFGRRPEVLLLHPVVGLDQVLDVAAASGATFVTIDETTFDTADLIDEGGFENGAQKPSGRLLAEIERRIGEPDGLFINWVSQGIFYTWHAVPQWRSKLGDDYDAWKDMKDQVDAFDLEQEWARVREVAAQLEALPSLRAKSVGRTAVAEAEVKKLVAAGEETIGHRAVWAAVTMTRENSAVAFAALEADLDAVADEVLAAPGWRQGFRKAERQAFVAQFLREKTGGYGPTGRFVADVLVAVDRREVWDIR